MILKTDKPQLLARCQSCDEPVYYPSGATKCSYCGMMLCGDCWVCHLDIHDEPWDWPTNGVYPAAPPAGEGV